MLPGLHRRQRRQVGKLTELARLLALGEFVADPAHEPDPDDAEQDDLLALAGIRRAGPSRAQQRWDAAQPFYLWPEHLDALLLWHEVGTQWLQGPAGLTGLSYPGVQAELQQRRWGPARRRERLWGQLKTMERAALKAWDDKRRQDQQDA